jgi:hypothetical protein
MQDIPRYQGEGIFIPIKYWDLTADRATSHGEGNEAHTDPNGQLRKEGLNHCLRSSIIGVAQSGLSVLPRCGVLTCAGHWIHCALRAVFKGFLARTKIQFRIGDTLLSDFGYWTEFKR